MCLTPINPNPEELLAKAEARIAAVSKRPRISIDQCFLLDMVEGEAAAVALRNALESSVQSGRALCPVHPEVSVFESSLFRPELRQRVFALQRSLAEGYCFHSFGQRVQHEVESFLLGRSLPAIWPRPFTPPDEQVEALSQANRAGRNDYQQRLDAVTPSPAMRTHTFGRILADLTQHHNRSFLRVVDALQQTQPLPGAPGTWEYAIVIGERLRDLRVTWSDLNRLRHLVNSGSWHQSAALVAFTRLWAAVERDGLQNNRRATANDMLDILRIAVGFADAQVILCDNAMMSFVRQARLLEVLPGRQVFGMRDIAAAMAYVAAL
jgi:hypothetical protein